MCCDDASRRPRVLASDGGGPFQQIWFTLEGKQWPALLPNPLVVPDGETEEGLLVGVLWRHSDEFKAAWLLHINYCGA